MKTTIMTLAVLIASLLVADFANAQSNQDLQ